MLQGPVPLLGTLLLATLFLAADGSAEAEPQAASPAVVEGEALLKDKRFVEAAERFAAAVAADPNDARALYDLAYARRRARQCQAAAVAYRRYAAIRPGQPDPFYGLGLCLQELGDRVGALSALRKYVELERRASEQRFVEKAKTEIAALEAMPAAPTAAAKVSPAPGAPAPPTPAPVTPAPPAPATAGRATPMLAAPAPAPPAPAVESPAVRAPAATGPPARFKAAPAAGGDGPARRNAAPADARTDAKPVPITAAAPVEKPSAALRVPAAVPATPGAAGKPVPSPVPDERTAESAQARNPPPDDGAAAAAPFMKLGAQALEGRRFDEAIAAFEQARRRAPRDAEPSYRLGAALALAGRLTEAGAAWSDALRRDPLHEGALQSRAKLEEKLKAEARTAEVGTAAVRAREHLRAGRYALAEAEADRILAARPEAGDVLVVRGRARLERGDAGGARRDFQQSLVRRAGSAEAFRGLADCYVAEGDAVRAAYYLELFAAATDDPAAARRADREIRDLRRRRAPGP